MFPTALHSPGLTNRLRQTPTRNSNGNIFGLYIPIGSPIGAKIEISSEKRFPARISSRSLAQSIRGGLENATPLGT